MSATIHPQNRRLVSERPRNAKLEKKAPKEPWDPDALWRQLRAIGRVLLAVAVLGAGVTAAIHARRYVTQSPRFGLRDLRIEGNRHRSKEQIAATAGVTLGQNVVEIDLEATRARLEHDPWIERATLSRRLPASLTIDVIEREAAAVVALPQGTYLATPLGEIFKRLETDDPSDLPIVTGIGPEDAAGDRESTAQLVRRALELGAEIERVGLFGGRVEELNVDPEGGLTAMIGKHAMRVVLGRAPYKNKIRLGMKIESELARRNARPTVVFLDDDIHPERVVVRLVSALPAAKITVDGAPEAPGKSGGKAVQ